MRAAAAFATIVLAAAAAVAATPSFDCARATAWVDRTICGDDTLALLDREMADAFARRRGELGDIGRQQLLADQRRWLASRRECETSRDAVTCLVERYRDRIATLLGRPRTPERRPSNDRGALGECRAEALDSSGVGLCLDRKLAEATAAFGDAEATMLRRMEGNVQALEAFRTSQEAFLSFRDATCRWRSALTGEESLDLRQGCLVDYTRARTAEIEGVRR